jgi:hypothetical protein
MIFESAARLARDDYGHGAVYWKRRKSARRCNKRAVTEKEISARRCFARDGETRRPNRREKSAPAVGCRQDPCRIPAIFVTPGDGAISLKTSQGKSPGVTNFSQFFPVVFMDGSRHWTVSKLYESSPVEQPTIPENAVAREFCFDCF